MGEDEKCTIIALGSHLKVKLALKKGTNSPPRIEQTNQWLGIDPD